MKRARLQFKENLLTTTKSVFGPDFPKGGPGEFRTRIGLHLFSFEVKFNSTVILGSVTSWERYLDRGKKNKFTALAYCDCMEPFSYRNIIFKS